MPDRARDVPMTPAERKAVSQAVNRGNRARKSAADNAYSKVLSMTGDRSRAERVRASVLGTKPAVSPLTTKAAKAGKLPSPSLSDTATRAQIQAAGITPKI